MVLVEMTMYVSATSLHPHAMKKKDVVYGKNERKESKKKIRQISLGYFRFSVVDQSSNL